MNTVRTFIAIELTDPIRQVLAELQSQLKKDPASRAGRWVSPAGMHLTLNFLGEVTLDAIQRIQEGIVRACASVLPFELCLSQTGAFPNPSRPRVLWVGLGGDVGALADLQRSIEREMEALGFAAERRKFEPHLTLARIREDARPGEGAALAKATTMLKIDGSVSMRVEEVSLMRSELRREGAVYTRLAAISLARQVDNE